MNQMNQIKYEVPQDLMDEIYISLNDAYERIPNGTMLIKRCINALESIYNFKPPQGYKETIEDTEPTTNPL